MSGNLQLTALGAALADASAAFNALAATQLTDPLPAPIPVPPASGTRTGLCAPATYYVSSAGSDVTGTGLLEAPWATPSHAYSWVRDNIDLSGFSVSVQVLTDITAPQVFTGPLTGQAFASDFAVVGNTGNPNAIKWSSPATACLVQEEARLSVSGFTMSAGSFGFLCGGGVIMVGNIYFNSVGNACLDACGPRSVITANGPLTWMHAQTFKTAATAEDHGQINLPCSLVISGVPTFTAAFLQADLGGMIDYSNATVALGSAQGKQYSALCMGIVFSGLPPGTPCTLPGNVPGVVSGGYFQ